MRLVVSSGIRLAGMPDMSDPKTVLRHYLQQVRDDLIWKLDGLGEREGQTPSYPDWQQPAWSPQALPQCRGWLLGAHLQP